MFWCAGGTQSVHDYVILRACGCILVFSWFSCSQIRQMYDLKSCLMTLVAGALMWHIFYKTRENSETFNYKSCISKSTDMSVQSYLPLSVTYQVSHLDRGTHSPTLLHENLRCCGNNYLRALTWCFCEDASELCDALNQNHINKHFGTGWRFQLALK